MGGDTIFNVDIASNIKAFVNSASGSVRFARPSDKAMITSADDDDILRVGFTIRSPVTITSVDKVDADFFRSHLFMSDEHRGD